MLFKLNWGTHKVVSGNTKKEFQAGDVIETNANLAELFTLRDPLSGKWKFEEIEGKTPDRPAITVIKRSPSTGEGITEQTPSPVTPSKSKKETPTEDPALGEDLTDEFPLAEELGFKVYFNGVKYVVVDTDSNETISKGKMSKPKDVDKILESYVADEDEEDK